MLRLKLFVVGMMLVTVMNVVTVVTVVSWRLSVHRRFICSSFVKENERNDDLLCQGVI